MSPLDGNAALTYTRMGVPVSLSMEAPRTWQEIESYVRNRIPESNVLDFKREFGSGPELAKDVAAMTLDGGVLIYGIDEESSGNVAARITKVKLAKLDSVHQIVNSRVSPVPYIEVLPIPENAGDEDGVIVVVIPESPLAPHCVNGSFPRRTGTVTDRMSEPDIERLYDIRRQRHTQSSPELPLVRMDELLEPLRVPDGAGGEELLDVGTVQIAARLSTETTHPRDPWLEGSLMEANSRSAIWNADHLPGNRLFGEAIARSAEFRTIDRTSRGIVLGRPPLMSLERKADAQVVLLYPSSLTLRATVPLHWNDDEETENSYPCVHEEILIPEVLGFLHFAGEWFSDYPSPGGINVSFRASGFGDAVAFTYTRNVSSVDTSALPTAEAMYDGSLSATRYDLSNSTKVVGKQLMRRWCATFLENEESYLRYTSRLTA